MAESPSNKNLLDDLKRVANEYNDPLTAKQYRTHGRYPLSKLYDRFGSWNEAKEDAGLNLNKSDSTDRTSKNTLIRDIHRVADQFGESPTVTQYKKAGKYPMNALKKQFGSWNEAKDQAGLETYTEEGNRKYTNEELLKDIQKFADECDRSPTFQEYRDRKGPDPTTIEDRFGSWNKAKEKAGINTNSRFGSKSYESKQHILDDLNYVAEKIGESPSSIQYAECGEYDPSAVHNAFGSWNNAKEKADLEIYSPDRLVPADELIHDIQRCADRLGTTPSKNQYDKHGTYSHTICQHRFGSWNNALQAANIEPNLEMNIPKDTIVDDIRNMASIVEGTPTSVEYTKYGEYGLGPIYRHFGSWIDALTAAGYDWTPYKYSNEELLKSLRDVSENEYAPRRFEYQQEWTHGNIRKRFGSWWAGCVQAGLLPRRRRPLSPRAIHEYHKAAINLEPHYRTYALLFQFTGIPSRIMQHFSADWVADRENRNIIRVPFEVTKSGEPWLFQYPDQWYNPYTEEKEDTELPGTLNWFCNVYEEVQRCKTTFPQIIKRVANKGGLKNYRRTMHHTNIGNIPDVNPEDLRMTNGVNLVEEGVDKKTIRSRLGIDESNWGGEVNDCYLWSYIHRNIEPKGYEPPDVVLNPVS